MRSLEFVLSIVNLSALCILIILRLKQSHRVRFMAYAPVILAVLEILILGYRWAMMPAYLLAFTLSAALSRQQAHPPTPRSQQNNIRRLVLGGLTGGGVLVFILSFLLPVFFPVFNLATPSGPYQIGTVSYAWTDTKRQELFSANTEDRRRLVVQVWYPVKGNSASARAPYVADAEAVSRGLAQTLSSNGLIKLPSFTFDSFKFVQTHAIPFAPIATDRASVPVLIYLTGLDGFRQANMFQVENLVSQGYVVVGIDQPYTAVSVTFPDGQAIMGLSKPQIQPLIDQSIRPVDPAPARNGRLLPDGIIPYLAEDVSFALDQLEVLNASDVAGILNGRLDLQHVGIFGVSLGAMTTAQACHNDPRLGACLMLDAAMPASVVKAGLMQPAMWLTRPAEDMRLERTRIGGWTERDIEETLSTMQAVFDKAKPGSSYFVSISGMFHLNFTDAPYYSPFTARLGLTGPINSRHGFDIVNAYTLAFFNKALRGQSSPLLRETAQQYPEVNIWIH